jgi:hypothetical protein
VIWGNGLGAKKDFNVIIQADFNLKLPSNDVYTIGFFIKTGNFLINVGQAIYTPNVKNNIYVNTDPQSNYAYNNGDTLISLVKNNTTFKTYGIEFKYINNKNTYFLDDSTIVSGVLANTWDPLFKYEAYCETDGNIELKIPFGVKPNFLIPNNTIYEIIGSSVLIKQSVMPRNTQYTFEVNQTNASITYTTSLYSYYLQQFPESKLNKTYVICPGNLISIDSLKIIDSLTRTPLNSKTPLIITKPGNYIYSSKYFNPSILQQLTCDCSKNDTIHVEFENNCPATPKTKLVNPFTNTSIFFEKNEKIKIYNASMEVVNVLQGPTLWEYTNSQSITLPVGIYYIFHEDEKSESLSIIY